MPTSSRSSVEAWLDELPATPIYEDWNTKPIDSKDGTRPDLSIRRAKRHALTEIFENQMEEHPAKRVHTSTYKTLDQQQSLGEENEQEMDDTELTKFSTPVNLQPPPRTSLDPDQTPKAPNLRKRAPLLLAPSSTSSQSGSSLHFPDGDSVLGSSTNNDTSVRSLGGTKLSRSPTKGIKQLGLNSTSIDFHNMNGSDHDLPLEVKTLRDQLRRIKMTTDIIPLAVKSKAQGYIDTLLLREGYFTTIEDDTAFSMGERRDHGFFSQQLSEEKVWIRVERVYHRALECSNDSLPESSWNGRVHSEVLELALTGRWRQQNIWYKEATVASIKPVTLASGMSIDGGPTKRASLQTKMVDYVMVVELDSVLREHIRAKLRLEGRDSINHTDARHLCWTPIAVSIETKRAHINEDEGYLQLCVWVGSHFARLQELATKIADTPGDKNGKNPVDTANIGSSKSTKMPILPLVFVQGHDWKLMIAERYLPARIRLWREIELGSTSSLLGIYQLLEAIGHLARWINEDYRRWLMEDVFN